MSSRYWKGHRTFPNVRGIRHPKCALKSRFMILPAITSCTILPGSRIHAVTQVRSFLRPAYLPVADARRRGACQEESGHNDHYEPHRNVRHRDTLAGWQAWRDGCLEPTRMWWKDLWDGHDRSCLDDREYSPICTSDDRLFWDRSLHVRVKLSC